MKKAIAALLCTIFLFCFSGCELSFTSKDQQLYNKAVTELVAALDSKDADALYNLFSPAIQAECADLKDKIQMLFSFYASPTEEIGDYSSIAIEESVEYGDEKTNGYTTFPVLAGGEYYWLYLDVVLENDFDKNQIGISQLDVCTADAYFDFWSGGKLQQLVNGINIFDKKTDGYSIISINNYPYNYRPTEALKLEDVKAFFDASTSLKEFVARFGKPAAKDEFGYIYPLPDQDGEKRYLYLGCEGTAILYSEIWGKYAYVDTILE